MFEQLKDIQNNDNSLLTELNILPELPAHLGGRVETIPSDLLQRETENDPELRQAILSGHVALVDTILRYVYLYNIPVYQDILHLYISILLYCVFTYISFFFIFIFFIDLSHGYIKLLNSPLHVIL